MLGVLHPTRRKNEGKNLGRKHLELSERRRKFARKNQRGKLAERMAVKKHKAARARSRLEELMFGTFNVCTAAVNGANCIGQIDTLLRPCAAKGCDVIGLQETKSDGISDRGIWIAHLFQRGQSQKRATWGWTGNKRGDR